MNWAIPKLAARRSAPVAASPEAVPDAALVDVSRIEELRSSLGEGVVDRLLDMLVRELGQRPALIRVHAHNADLNVARSEAHNLRGAASNMGATALSETAAAIERAGDLAAVEDQLAALDDRARRTADWITAWR